MVEELKQLRIKIDSYMQVLEKLYDPKEQEMYEIDAVSINVYKAFDNMRLSKAWLGQCLVECGASSPYKAGYKTKEDIEPTADRAPEWKPELGPSYIESLDILREGIREITEEIKSFKTDQAVTREFAIARTNAFSCAHQAKFYLGFELQKIKEENNG